MKTKFFNDDKHLTDISVSLYADAVKLGLINRLPKDIYDHVNSCLHCSDSVNHLLRFLEDEDYSHLTQHPFFGELNSTVSIPDNAADLDQILAQLKAEALPIPMYERLIDQQLTYRNLFVAVINVKAPVKDQLCTKEVNFELVTDSDQPITLIVENQKERVLKTTLEADTSSFKLSLDPTDKFPSGLYYWKAALKGGKAIVGKFYVYNPPLSKSA